MSNVTGGPDIVTDSLVFCIDAANPKCYVSGNTTTIDIISNTTGSWSNTGIFSSNNSGIFVLGGTNDYLTYQSTTLPELGTTYTYGLWIKSTDTVGELFCSFEQVGPWEGMLFGIGFSGPAGKLSIWMCNNSGISTATIDTGAVVNDGNWKYVAVTYDGSNARFYHNAVLSSTVSVSNAVGASTQPFRVGASNNVGPDRIYAGSIGPGYIYNRTLSASEILQNYNAQKSRFNL